MKMTLKYAALLVSVLLVSIGSARAQVSMQIVADNDFALFAGDSTNVTRLVYQNNFSWPDQLSNLESFTFNLQPGETTFYLLGMGGGGNENISGTVNGVDLTTIDVSASSDLSPYLTGYLIDDGDGGLTSDPSVANGTYDASLSDVQAALPNLTWGSPTPTDPDNDGVAAQSPTGQGFHFDPNNADLFRFSAADVNVEQVPEPSTYALLAVAGLVLAVSRRRRSALH